MPTTIEIYPPVPRPEWLRPGSKVYVSGEARDIFVATTISHLAAFLVDNAGRPHGWESFTKLSEVCEVTMFCVMCEKKEEVLWPTKKLDPKNLPIGWYNYLGGKTYCCGDCVSGQA